MVAPYRIDEIFYSCYTETAKGMDAVWRDVVGRWRMKQYRLPVIMHQPSEETENKYMAEIPVLPGCRAWGDTPREALEYLQDVASKFILSYKKHGDSLPRAIEEAAYELVGARTAATEVTVYL